MFTTIVVFVDLNITMFHLDNNFKQRIKELQIIINKTFDSCTVYIHVGAEGTRWALVHRCSWEALDIHVKFIVAVY